QRPDILFNEGFIPNPKDTTALPPPLLGNKTRIVDLDERVVLKHKLQGVTIEYTTNGIDPDSTTSEVYSKPFKLPDSTQVMARAYKDGWLPSEAVSFPFFKKGFEPEKLVLLTQPNEKYQGKGAASLIDWETGSAEDYKGRAWLGFDNEPFNVQIDFGEKAPTIQQVVLSYGQNMRQNIMPPVAFEVWGGNDISELKLIKRVTPTVPSKNQGNREDMVPVSFAPSEFRYYKVMAFPIEKLPKWHRQKGKKGLLFVDQLFFY
ncbi:MAG: chitobiase/beta-hexosaminidase C-terminal domain-containing protein, partial [Maribacter sp.]|nr:chitobiase/beta-hexosaminidase C-terminal domain-containing protein [Maribacter sp.]